MENDIPLMRGRGKRRGNAFKNDGRGGNFKRMCSSGRTMDRQDFGSSESVASTSSNYSASESGKSGFRPFGYNRLITLSNQSDLKIMQILSQADTQKEFMAVCCQKDLKDDWLLAIMKIMAKLGCAEFNNITGRLFAVICSKDFLNKLLLYVVSFDEISNKKEFFNDFFETLCSFFKGLLKLLPSLACERLGKLLQQTSIVLNACEFAEQENIRGLLKLIETDLNVLKERRMVKKGPVEKAAVALPHSSVPPNNFRDMEVYPVVEDLICAYRPYLRPNLKVGPYENVDHYLDVQFRLMREDCIRPVREGIAEYQKKLKSFSQEPRKNLKVDNIRIYERTEFVGLRPEEDKLCIELCFDIKKKMCTKINWEHSKRFLKGALLILTKDNFASFSLMRVAKRNLKDVEDGRILVESYENSTFEDVFDGQFLMVESQVFFAPYFHVLQALKEFNVSNFPFKEFLIEGKCNKQNPTYLRNLEKACYKIPLPSNTLENEEGMKSSLFVFCNLNEETSWPSPEVLGLDNSQHRALKGALTNKVMLIQGPPGTGKTFMGLKIIQTLLLNEEAWRSSEEPRPILIICYTNHALDQFLVGINEFTDEIVRCGGRSKEPSLEKYSLNALRRNRLFGEGQLYKMLWDHRTRFKEVKESYEVVGRAIEFVKNNCGIVSPETFLEYSVMSEGHFDSFHSPENFIYWLEEGAVDSNLSAARSRDISFDTFVQTLINSDFEIQETNVALQHLKEVHILLSFCKVKNIITILQNERDALSQFLCKQLEERILFHRAQLENIQSNPRRINMNSIDKLRNLWVLPRMKRWQLYRHWVETLTQSLNSISMELGRKYRDAANVLEEARMVEERAIMANKLIIGMTTSHAASRQSVLKKLNPRIVVVEEAAEVLESHIVVSLAGNVEHLILIGDHQQLRPNPAVYELARKFYLDVSLFERLLNNKVECVTLSTQHRMRPQIAKLICPAVYPELLNHSSVEFFPNIKGVVSNLYFLNHHHPEEEVKEIDSFKNPHEAHFLASFIRYLILQGYEPSKITLLCTYKGQTIFLSKLKSEYPQLADVRITVVDNYQGEENDIVLLSLVRSNEENAVGFLKTDNRICVALSRARHGFFMIGNIDNLTAKGKLWMKVKEELIKQNALVGEILLQCEVHSTLTPVKTAEDFFNCPEGGCLKQCGVLKLCGHICQQLCHSTDREHKDVICMEKCERPLCEENHICPDKCFENCKLCMVPKTVMLPCDHQADMPCHVQPKDYRCKAKISVNLPHCSHENEIYCHQSKNLDSVECKVLCPHRLPCGHACERKCHPLRDPLHERYKCRKACARLNYNCSLNHICTKLCFEECEECTVNVLKNLDCGHQWTMKCSAAPSRKLCRRKCKSLNPCGHACTKRCQDECLPCSTEVLKRIQSCGHDQMMPCGQDPNSFNDCKSACEKVLVCSHKCTNRCGEECTSTCHEIIPFLKLAYCGHAVSVPCHQISSFEANLSQLHKLCQEPCNEILKCGHLCQGTCGKCLQGRFHQSCKQKCGRVLVCGHPCSASCTVSCPPCGKQCQVECIHSKCGGRCGEPCVPCIEKCVVQCRHQKCLRKCSETCSMKPCMEPCKKKMKKCQHNCISLCGEQCLCRECNEEQVSSIFFGFEEEEEARFVKLPDCSHIFEVKGLQKWLEVVDNQIKSRLCPKCCTPIMRCARFNNKEYAKDIAKVKLKVYGNFDQIKKVALESSKLLNFSSYLDGCPQAVQLLEQVKTKLSNLLKSWPKERKRGWARTPPLSLSEASNLQQCCRVLVTLNDLSKACRVKVSFKDNVQQVELLKKFLSEIQTNVDDFCGHLRKRNLVHLSEQEACDLECELERINSLCLVCQIQSCPEFTLLSPDLRILFNEVSEIVRGIKPFPLSEAVDIKCKLKDLFGKVFGCPPSKQEISSIRAAIGLSQGHWFKCPNGHIYAIGECGGAMQTSVCPECRHIIGGSDHRLQAGNTLASEMDGARQAAYPTM